MLRCCHRVWTPKTKCIMTRDIDRDAATIVGNLKAIALNDQVDGKPSIFLARSEASGTVERIIDKIGDRRYERYIFHEHVNKERLSRRCVDVEIYAGAADYFSRHVFTLCQ